MREGFVSGLLKFTSSTYDGLISSKARNLFLNEINDCKQQVPRFARNEAETRDPE